MAGRPRAAHAHTRTSLRPIVFGPSRDQTCRSFVCVHVSCVCRVWGSRPRRSTSCGSGLSVRSEVYYFSAPNIAYFTVYSTTRAHDSRITRAPQTSELSHRERPHASAQHAAATCSTPLLPLTTCGPAGSRPTVTSERATRLPHRKGRHTAASSRSGHGDLPAPLLPAPRQDPPTRLVRVAPAAHTRHLGLGLRL